MSGDANENDRLGDSPLSLRVIMIGRSHKITFTSDYQIFLLSK